MSNENNRKVNKDDRLNKADAEAASPMAESIAGEEDPGAALEQFITDQKPEAKQRNK